MGLPKWYRVMNVSDIILNNHVSRTLYYNDLKWEIQDNGNVCKAQLANSSTSDFSRYYLNYYQLLSYLVYPMCKNLHLHTVVLFTMLWIVVYHRECFLLNSICFIECYKINIYSDNESKSYFINSFSFISIKVLNFPMQTSC